jgi:hypothetical protein
MPGGRFAPSDVTGKILTQWNERESTRRQSWPCRSIGRPGRIVMISTSAAGFRSVNASRSTLITSSRTTLGKAQSANKCAWTHTQCLLLSVVSAVQEENIPQSPGMACGLQAHSWAWTPVPPWSRRLPEVCNMPESGDVIALRSSGSRNLWWSPAASWQSHQGTSAAYSWYHRGG